MASGTRVRRLLLVGLAGLAGLAGRAVEAGPRPREAAPGLPASSWPRGPIAGPPAHPAVPPSAWGPAVACPPPAVVLPDPGPAHAAELDAAIARLGYLLREGEARDAARQP
jgi:hypothetical protein